MRLKCVITGILLSLLLCSCGKEQVIDQTTQTRETDAQEETEPGEVTAEKVYVLNDISMPDADEALGDLLPEGGKRNILLKELADENLYYFVEIYPEDGNYDIVNYYVQILRPPYTEWVTYPVDMTEYVQESGYYVKEASVKTDGTVGLLVADGDDNYIGEWSAEEGFSAKDLSADIQLNEILYSNMFPVWYDDEEAGLFFLNVGIFLCYDENNEEKSVAPEKAGGLILQISENLFSGKLYFMGANAESWSMTESGGIMIEDGGFSIWTADSEQAVFVAQNTSDSSLEEIGCFMAKRADCVAFSSETEGYLCNEMGIYQFSMEDQSRKEIFDFAEAGMGSDIRSMSMSVGEDGIPLVMCEYSDGTGWFARLKEQTETGAEKQQLEFAMTLGADACLQKAIVDFNKQSTEYEVVLRTCPEGECLDDYRSRIQAELSAGKGPDIMTSSVLELRSGSEKGYLLDLTEYYAPYRETVFPAARQLGKVDERYFGMPYQFSVSTLVADKDVVGNRQHWNLKEAMQCMEQSGADTFIGQMDKDYSYYYLGLVTENAGFIDWENRASHLDGADSYELLEFVTRYSRVDTEASVYGLEQLATGECLTGIVYFVTPLMAQNVSEYLQGREVYIGFPTEGNTGGHRITAEILEINRNSSHTEGAMQFLEYLLSEEQQTRQADLLLKEGSVSSYPVRNDTLEKLFDDLRERAEVWAKAQEQGQDVWTEGTVLTLTSEQYDALWEVLENAQVYSNDTEMVLDMLSEEAGAYWSGSKTAQQVMDILNNRVQLYLDELN